MSSTPSDSIEELSTAIVCSITGDTETDSEQSVARQKSAEKSSESDNKGGHPSLIVTPDMYSDLRERSKKDPWRSWERRAREFLEIDIDSVSPVAEPGNEQIAEFYAENRSVFQHCSAATLLYILDPQNRDEYASVVYDAICYYHDNILPEIRDSWSYTVYPSGVFFSLVLGLDVVAPRLSEAQLTDAERKLAAVAEWYWEHRDGAWPSARYGAYGVWAAYTGDEHRLQAATENLLSLFAHDFNDGPYQDGCAYAQGRFLGTFPRNAKSHFLDVLAFASDVDLYGVDFINRAYNWMFGYARTPIVYDPSVGPTDRDLDWFHPGRDNYTFGDTRLQYHITASNSGTYRAGKFDDEVENSAAWALIGENPEGARNSPVDISASAFPHNRNVFLSYVLTESVPSEPEPIPSRIFDAGGAWFHEDSHDTETLAGACWNSTTAGGHSHSDTNALHLCGYGEHLLRNAGYSGYGSGLEGFDWEYVHDRAVSNNVAMLNYAFADDRAPPAGAHQQKAGAGITEGFLPGPVGYASGDSGGALAGGRHHRNFLYVPPTTDTTGYWLLFDEVGFDTATQPETVHTALHPNSAQRPEIQGDRFSATTPVGGPYPRSENDVSLTVAYGTRPDALAVRDGALAAGNEGYVGKYLYATYQTDEQRKQVATALVPHDGDHAKPTLSRFSGKDVSGVTIDHGDATDWGLELHTDERARIGNKTVTGDAALVRTVDDCSQLYFVRRGTSFTHGDVGFDANSPVSVALEGDTGKLTTPIETSVRFDAPGVTGVELNGVPVSNTDSGRGFVRVPVPTGRHDVRLI